MADPVAFVYNNARHLFATKQLNWLSMVVKVALVTAAYAPSRSHVFLSEVGGIVARSDEMTNKAETAGICRGDLPEFLALSNPNEVVGVVMYIDSGDDATSKLLYFTNDGPGLPFTPAGINYFFGYDLLSGGFFEV